MSYQGIELLQSITKALPLTVKPITVSSKKELVVGFCIY
jgi:hypothetical protein